MSSDPVTRAINDDGGLAMSEVRVGDHDPNAQDMSAADQTVLNQIEGERQQAAEQAIQQAESASVAVVDPLAASAQQAQAASALGRGFVFTPEQVNDLLRRAVDQRDKFVRYAQKAAPFGHMDLAPSPDQPGSLTQARAVNESFANLEALAKSQAAFLTDWINKLTAAKQNYMRQEHLTETQWDRLGSGRRP